MHYDVTAEVRAKGAGFYQFSADEETRQRQMEELKLAREETERMRKEGGAVDLKPGEVEGLRDDEIGGNGGKKSSHGKKKKGDRRTKEDG